MNPISRSFHEPWVRPSVLIIAIAVLAVFANHSFAQSKPAADSAASSPLPYGVSRQESSPGRSPEFPPPLGVTELAGDAKNPPSASAVPTAPVIPPELKTAAPAATPKPRDPLWDSPDAQSVGVESSEALSRKYQLSANPHGMGHTSPIGWLSLLGLLGLAAVAVVLSQRERGRDRKAGRRSSRRAL